LFAPSLALETVTGIPKEYAILLIGLVGAFYSIILMFASVLVVSITGLIYAGGFGEIFRVAREGGRLEIWK